MKESANKLLYALTGFGSQKMEEIGIPAFFLILFVSFLSSMLISYLYVYFYSNRSTGSQIHRSFPLLGISITAIFICIQFSLPLSLGLLGALSIVRFRTPIKEPEEIGFLMLLIASSIACGTFNFTFLGIILVIAITALLIFIYIPGILSTRTNKGLIVIRLPSSAYAENNSEITMILNKKLPQGFLESIFKNEDESTITYSFSRVNQNDISQIETDLTNLNYIKNFNIFFSRPGTL